MFFFKLLYFFNSLHNYYSEVYLGVNLMVYARKWLKITWHVPLKTRGGVLVSSVASSFPESLFWEWGWSKWFGENQRTWKFISCTGNKGGHFDKTLYFYFRDPPIYSFFFISSGHSISSVPKLGGSKRQSLWRNTPNTRSPTVFHHFIKHSSHFLVKICITIYLQRT